MKLAIKQLLSLICNLVGLVNKLFIQSCPKKTVNCYTMPSYAIDN